MVVTAGPTRTAAVLLLLAGCAAALLSLVADPAGRVLLLPAAALVVALGLRDLLLRPVLHADVSGLEVVTGLRRLHATEKIDQDVGVEQRPHHSERAFSW